MYDSSIEAHCWSVINKQHLAMCSSHDMESMLTVMPARFTLRVLNLRLDFAKFSNRKYMFFWKTTIYKLGKYVMENSFQNATGCDIQDLIIVLRIHFFIRQPALEWPKQYKQLNEMNKATKHLGNYTGNA